MDLETQLGFGSDQVVTDDDLIRFVNMKLIANGQAPYRDKLDEKFFDIAAPFFEQYQAKSRVFSAYYCPADQRIQAFLAQYFFDVPEWPKDWLPAKTFILSRHGLARMMSVPPDTRRYVSPYVNSVRVKQGILHNPAHDKRTTQGVFHIAEGGLPIPHDKVSVPKAVAARLLMAAFSAPETELEIPFTSTQSEKAAMYLSLMLRPVVCPEVPGWQKEKSMEIRCFAPGGFVSNLDFLESIFGNAGDPYLPKNDAGLDIDHWTGHTGCIILAPHLTRLSKKALGLPHVDSATVLQKRDGMCWTNPDESYNNGKAFKLTCRDKSGVMVTVIADNYFGYCKKEVKTQISYAANLFGLCEEEHSGGVLAFPSYDLGEDFLQKNEWPKRDKSFSERCDEFREVMDIQPEGYAIDRQYPSIVYVPENAEFHLISSVVKWGEGDEKFSIPLKPLVTYVLPSGYRVELRKHGEQDRWRLIGTPAEGVLCHKPSTVSGGGKSEISKPLTNSMLTGPVYISDIVRDFDTIETIMATDFSKRFRRPQDISSKNRPILSDKRTLGSVIKLLTPSSDYTDEYNQWLRGIPADIKTIIYAIKKLSKPEWGSDWRSHFIVDMINGDKAHELKYHNRLLTSYFFRVGFNPDGSWRVFNARYDYSTADKLQLEDDITASVVVPASLLNDIDPKLGKESYKFVHNCEYRLFQRPDDAIHPGLDLNAESDLSKPGNFLSNYEPLTLKDARSIVENILEFDAYSKPMKELIQAMSLSDSTTYFCASSRPRLVDGHPTKNPRYLQDRQDITDPQKGYLMQMCTRFARSIPLSRPVVYPVNAVLAGRRSNGPDRKSDVPSLAVYNPIHYQPLPELFVDFISSVTGKSPSTTGFGSEGALTKAPFNALRPAADLNNAFLSYVLTGTYGFTTAAGVIGPNVQIDHDVSLLIPEIWCRMTPAEQNPFHLIEIGCLEKVADFEFEGRQIPAGLLGYRITLKFVNLFMGRIFNNPNVVFSEEMLRPELQSLPLFVEGIDNLLSTHQRVAKGYLEDGTVDELCPPLRALVQLMAAGRFDSKTFHDPEFRKMFEREEVVNSTWYQDRLRAKQTQDIQLFERHRSYLTTFKTVKHNADILSDLDIPGRLKAVENELDRVKRAAYLDSLHGTLGLQPWA